VEEADGEIDRRWWDAWMRRWIDSDARWVASMGGGRQRSQPGGREERVTAEVAAAQDASWSRRGATTTAQDVP
jgi:hypothetical protein